MRRRPRRGMALLAAMVLLAMSTALVVGTFSIARAMQHAALVSRARARVEAGVQRAFADVLVQWRPGFDSLAVGIAADVALEAEPPDAGPPLVRRVRVQRVAERLYAITVELRAFTWEHPVAQRRARLWLARSSSTPAGALPVLVTPWPFSDLY